MSAFRAGRAVLVLLLLAPAAAAFAPPTSRVPSSTNHHRTSPLYNKKKKRRSGSSTSKGFGSGGSSSASAVSSSGTTLIKPKGSDTNFRYAGTIRPGLQTPKRLVPSEKIAFPDYALDGQPKNRPALFPWVIETKKPEEIEKMRASGRCAREVLDLAGRAVAPGITT